MDRLLRDFAGKVRVELRDGTGELVDADDPAGVTAAVTDSAGVAVAGSPFAAGRVSTGVYEVAVPAAVTATLDTFEVRWSATIIGQPIAPRSGFEVVGGYLFGLADLRALDPVLADEAKFPLTALADAREAAEERLETLCAVAFRPRGRRAALSGDGQRTLLLPDVEPLRLVSASVARWPGADPQVFDDEDLADITLLEWGAAIRQSRGVWPAGERNLSLLYEHGLDAPPEPVRRAALVLARAVLVRSAVPDRATSESTDTGTIRYSIAGRDGPTGFPEVDAVIEQFGRRTPAVGATGVVPDTPRGRSW